jgi:putative CocE/NonD family hydrolase
MTSSDVIHFSYHKKMKFTFFCLIFFVPFFCAAQLAKMDSVWMAAHYMKMERMIPVRDGVKLFTAVYVPKDQSAKHPFLLMRTPYSCAPYGENKFTDRFTSRGDSIYFHRNYIMVYQDVRGRFMSEGTFEDVRPFIHDKKNKKDIDEASDAYDTIDWLLKNIRNNNGNVGAFGISYPGFYATETALSNHPALKAVSPQAPVTDWFIGDDFHHKGVPFVLDAFDFYREFGVPRPQPLQNYPPVPPVKYQDNYGFFLDHGTYHDLTQHYMGDSIKFWNDVAAHPNYDSWWQARNVRTGCYDVKPAILIVGGLFDAEDCYGGWNLYKAIESQSPSTNCRLVEGPWFHGGWKRSTGEQLGNIWFGGRTADYFVNNMELPFFEYYLNGKGSAEQISEATVFITGENKWHHFDRWPPQGATPSSLYFGNDGKLSADKSIITDVASYDEYVSDPMKPVPYAEQIHSERTREYMTDDQRFASRRPDVLVYKSEILNNDVTITGPVNASLFVSLSGSDADFVVKLVDVFPDDFKYPDTVNIKYPMGGYQMLVRGEIMRGRFRNSFEKPEAFTPGQVTEVKFELPDVAHTFQKGHRIMVQVQSTWYPLADRNPQQFIDPYQCSENDLKSCTIRMYHDATHPSAITFPVLKN